MVLKNPRTRDAIIGAAAQVNAKVRQSAESFIQAEVAPLRERIEELEARVDQLERLLAGSAAPSGPTRRSEFDPDNV
jgi:tetrahydromethanopterin S-methyltransferase subunit B